MDCREIIKIMPAFLEGDLSPDEMKMAEDHLSGCKACRDELEIFKKTWDSLDAFEEMEPSASFEDRFWEKAQKPGLLDRFLSLFTFRVPAWAVAILLIISFGAGFIPETFNNNQKVQTTVVYVPVSDNELTETDIVPGKMAVSLPRATQVIKDVEPATELDILPSWDEDYTLKRIDTDTIFESAQS